MKASPGAGGRASRILTRTVLAGCALLAVGDVLSLWVSSSSTPQWAVPATLLGAGFAIAAGGSVNRTPHVPGARVLLTAAVLLLLAPVAGLAAGARIGDVAATAGITVLSCGLLRIVEAPTARRTQRALLAVVVGSGAAAATAVVAGSPDAVALALLGGLAALFAGGWVLFEATTGAARRQLLWLVLGVCSSVPTATLFLVAAENIPGPFVNALFVASLLCLPLPLTTGIALLAPDHRDVRPLISRVVCGAVMVTLSVSAFAMMVGLFRLVSDRPPGVGVLGLVAAAIGAAYHPVLVQARNTIDELLFGGRAEPLPTLAKLGEQLSTATAPEEWLESLRRSLAVQGLVLRHDGLQVASAGLLGERVETLPLLAGSEAPGVLLIGLSPDQLSLPARTLAVLRLVSGPLGQALQSAHLSEQLRRSRGEVVGVLEEERRRMRRDLHDGLGPTLAGVAASADAAANLLQSKPDEAAALVHLLRADVGEAIAEIRRIVYGLRPRALDELGLVGAVRQQTGRLRAGNGRPLQVDVVAGELPDLPAAVEVAAYRVAVEAVTNVARHAGVGATRVVLQVNLDGALEVVVSDSGAGTRPWTEGVGIASMRERVEQLGGSLDIASGQGGGSVRARLPLPL